MAEAAVLVALLAGCSGSEVPPPAGASSPSATTSAAPTPSRTTAPNTTGGLPTTLQAVPRGELTGFRVERAGERLIDAGSSGLARYNTSERCEVPGQPCYDAPTLNQVARIDLGAAPTVPGTETTFVTGHSNRFHPDDPARGVFSRLQEVRTGDTVVLTTTAGVFTYTVTQVLSVPFDRLTSTDEVVRVRPDTVVAISCVIAPDRASYLGNYVVVGTLRESSPT
jgi:LPXTG-site transpeptidase (sortase) family protein